MKVSVIIPNYNHSIFLLQRIESILDQTYKDYELIILDDCSTDNSRAIIDFYKTKYPDLRSYYNESNSGNPFMQWNYGVSKATGEYIWIAESDDFAKSDFLERTVTILNNYPDAGLVFTDSRIINAQKGTEYMASERRADFSNHKLEQLFNNGCDKRKSMNIFFENPIVNVSSVLFRKSAYLEAGGADPSMRFCGDWLLYIQMLLISDIAYIPLPLNIFRLHSESSFNSYYRSNRFLRETIQTYHFIIGNIRLGFSKKLRIAARIYKIALLRLVRRFIR